MTTYCLLLHCQTGFAAMDSDGGGLVRQMLKREASRLAMSTHLFWTGLAAGLQRTDR